MKKHATPLTLPNKILATIALLTMLLLCLIVNTSKAQSGTSCSTPINLVTQNIYSPTEYGVSANMIKWFSFVCDSQEVTLILREPVIAEAASLSGVYIYNGCSTLIKTQTLTKQDSNKVDIVMNDLTVGLTYKIKIVFSTLGKFQLNLSSRSSGGPCTPATGCELINNGNFTQFNPNPIDTNPNKNAFYKQYVCYWNSTANTPDLFSSTTPGLSPYYFAGWAQYGSAEGLYQNLSKPLQEGRKYVLSYSIRNYHPDNPHILSDYYVMIKNNTGSGFLSGTVAGTRQQIYQGTNVPHSATWVTQYVCFTANSNFNQIYFFGNMDTANTQAWLMLDNITLKMVDAGNDVVSSATCTSVSTTIGTSCVIAGATYSWTSSPAGGPYGTGSSINVSPSVNTTYTMTVLMPGGCTSTDKVTVYVNGCNLVQNSGFECKISAPNAMDQITLAQPWTAAPASGIPDFYHKDATNGNVADVPVPVFNQSPNGGTNGMAGIRVYSNGTNQRDYLQLILSTPLTSGNYTAEMWVCLRNNSFNKIKNLGMYISNTPIAPGTPVPPNTYTPQIVGNINAPYYGYTWTKISGCYNAIGGENYITIGNFATDASTLKANGSGSDLNSYYFIDDVSIKKIGVSTNADTSIFCGQSKQLTAIATNSCGQPLSTSFSWSPSLGLNNPNIFNPVATPASTTSYIVTATMNGVGCTMKDTVTIHVDTIPLVFYYGPNGSDTISICADDSYPLWTWIISPPWQPGFLTGNGVDTNTGWFHSTITGPGFHPVTYTYTSLPACTSIANLTVWVKDTVSFPPLPAVIFCPGNYDTLLLNTATPVGENLACSNYYGPGVVYDSINDVFYFDPAIAGAGVHTITYTYYDCVLGCTDTATQTVTVDICNWVEQTIGTSLSNAQSNAVAVDPATGDIYITGKVLRTVDFGGISTLTGPGPLYPTNFFIAKYNNCAELQWLQTAMGVSGSAAEGLAIVVDANGNAYVTGKFIGSFNFGVPPVLNSTSEDIFLAKYDSSGNFIWACKGGGSGSDAATGITIDANNIYVTGHVAGSANSSLEEPAGFGATGGPVPLVTQNFQNFFIASYDQGSGNINWAQNNFTINTSLGSGQFSKSNAIATYSNLICVTGSYQGQVTLATGITLGLETMPSGFTACFSATNGSPQWANIIAPSATNEYCEGKSIAINQDGDVFVTGNFKGFIHSPFYLEGVQDGSGAYTQDIYVVKYNGSNGSTIWVNGEGGEGVDGGQAICLDDESAYVTGYFAGSTNADFSGTVMSGFGTGTKDVFVVKYIGSSGNLASVSQPIKEYGGSGNDQGNGICLGPTSDLLITGTFRNPNADFDGITLTPGTTNDEIFLKNICDAQNNFKISGGKQGENNSEIIPEDAKTQVYLFPNPTKNLFTLQWSLKKESSLKVTITDVFGRKIYQGNLSHTKSGKQEVDLSKYASGLYFVYINAEGVNNVIKLVKQ